jgi:hypothetical protein
MKSLLLLLLALPCFIAPMLAQPAGSGEIDIPFAQSASPGALSFEIALAFPHGTDMNAAKSALAGRLRNVGVEKFEMMLVGDTVTMALHGISAIEPVLHLALASQGVTSVSPATPDDGWLRGTVSRLVAERALPLAIAEGSESVTLTRTRHGGKGVPLLPAKLVDALDSAALVAGKHPRYQPTSESLTIMLADPARSLELGPFDSVRARSSAMGGYLLALYPSPALKKRLKDFTSALVGKKIILAIDDEVISSPTVMSPIEEAAIYVSFGSEYSLESVKRDAFLMSLTQLPARPVIVRENVLPLIRDGR